MLTAVTFSFYICGVILTRLSFPFLLLKKCFPTHVVDHKVHQPQIQAATRRARSGAGAKAASNGNEALTFTGYTKRTCCNHRHLFPFRWQLSVMTQSDCQVEIPPVPPPPLDLSVHCFAILFVSSSIYFVTIVLVK